MELRNLKTFQVVAEELNLTKAAKILGYTQPTLTLQIQALEKELQHTLLTRIGKKTFLTSAGKNLRFVWITYHQKLYEITPQCKGKSITIK
jgi:DNA-binding transcriptional LysR family regulator